MMIPRKFSLFQRHGVAMAAACSLLAAGSAFGQAGYSTTFDNTGTFVTGSTLSGQGGWDTTDPDKTPPVAPPGAAEFVGQADYVGIISGYSQTATDQQAFLGGLQHGTTTGTTLPGSTTTYLYHNFSVSGATTSYAFNTDLAITSSVSPYTGRDSFGWTLRSGTGATGTNVFSLNFTPSTGPTSLNIGYTQYAPLTGTALNTTATTNAIPYNSRYHLSMSVNLVAGGSGLLSISLTNMSTGVVTDVADNILIANATGVTEAAATWILATPATADAAGGYTSAGSNALIFNNYFVTIPEPSTYVMVGLGIVAAAVYARRRVRA